MKFLYYYKNGNNKIADAIADINIADILKVAHNSKIVNAGVEIGIRINTLLPLTAERHNKITVWINVLDETVSVTRHSFNSIWDEDVEKLEISDSEIQALLAFEDEHFRANFL